jgi:hypothetical protein
MNTRRITITAITIGLVLCAQGQARRGPKPAGPGHGPGVRVRPLLHPPSGARRIVIAGVPHWYYGGVYYKLGGDGYVTVSLPVVRVIPPRHRIVLVGGVIYYVADGVYYQSVPGGYIIVRDVPKVKQETAVAEAPKPQEDTFTLYVPKKNDDGFVPVVLKRLEGGFLGPQGEFYPTVPSIEWLTEMYGIPQELRQARPDAFFIHVPDKDGKGFTRVELTRHGRGFLGPQGEFYPVMPSVAQLTQMYGASGESAEPEEQVVTIQVPKKNGDGFVEVKLTKRDGGYIGPQGEFYSEIPSKEILTEVYGDKQ